MRVSYGWLSEYVDVTGYSASDLAEKLTRSGVEVDIVEKLNQGITNVVVGYVKTCEKHPNADKLSLCTVDVGKEEDLQIICGAKNIAAGQKVPVAVPGAVLPGNFKIKKAKLRGVESYGMICSAKELGMNDRLLPKEIQEGILVLPDDTNVGDDILEVLGLNDEVLELELTPNRSDCLSMIGTAYEIAAILGREVKLPLAEVSSSSTIAADKISVKNLSPENCHHYSARYIEEVSIQPSPLWMQNRLMAAGIRPINNIVDITNYVMLEYGQPLHAFDADQLNEGHIEVRLAEKDEKMTTLDEVERTLEESMLLITDGTKPVAIAGVMGGANSEVQAETINILLESAKFSGSSVRITSKKLGLRSESSLRFEKEVNPENVTAALNRAAVLLSQYANGKVADGIVEELSVQNPATNIEISLRKVNDYLGTDLSKEDVKHVFDRLHFSYTETDESNVVVHVPSRRGDITRDVDLIEEVARIHGYDHIPTSLMVGVTTPGSLTKEQKIRRAIRRILTDEGLHEVINYSFTHPSQIKLFPGMYAESKHVKLALPMSEERSTLRTSLIPHLLDVAAYNNNRNQADVRIFETGRVFLTEEETLSRLPEEKELLSILLTGKRETAHWSVQENKVDFYDLKGHVETLFEYLGIIGLEFVSASPNGFHPGRTASIQINTGEQNIELGWIGQLHPSIQQEKDLEEVYILEIALEEVYKLSSFDIEYVSLPKYPAIGRDIAIVVGQTLQIGEIVNSIKETAKELLESVSVFDIYTGEKVSSGKKSVALSLTYRHNERTLTDEEVTELHSKVVEEIEKSFNAELRK
ncbi:phenylalanine--tRNA ligase subunit beta [Chengkuizengella axinellae]|uniref:Phenylalanine--tRNA ligase beta subunit n=1 Tax=Chengkuizengella axinellae TaxID=3064388 RepID=A0ABT9J547_9BACL|nr:phenylalanine--tRNA ligase subunit beta [Chengkuizengella sp. 2205SS18-9]MDP5276598.1 phenylalanine--tRNA ligase subunit beta [Chengkuizengella sp. 2205SS18-9]